MHDPRVSMPRALANRQPLAGRWVRSAVGNGFDPPQDWLRFRTHPRKWVRSALKLALFPRPQMASIRAEIGFVFAPTARNGSVPREKWLRSRAHPPGWLRSRPEMASIPPPPLASFRILGGFDPRNGSVPTSGPCPTMRPGAGWFLGARGLGPIMGNSHPRSDAPIGPTRADHRPILKMIGEFEVGLAQFLRMRAVPVRVAHRITHSHTVTVIDLPGPCGVWPGLEDRRSESRS
jgi:hypothetical protein